MIDGLTLIAATILAGIVLLIADARWGHLIRHPWVCGTCKARFTTLAALIAHEREHGYCPCGGDRTTGTGHAYECSQRMGVRS